MKYFIDGTCCLFKTSTLLNLKMENVPVLTGDFYEHSTGEPLLLNKLKDPVTDLIYQAFVSSRLKEDYVHDRLPFTNICYALIFSLMAKEKTMEDAGNYFRLMKSLKIFPATWRALILTSNNPHAVLEKMRERSNGIDVLTINYVETQDLVFECFARVFDLPTLKIDVRKPVQMINTITAFVYQMRGSCVLLTSPLTLLKISQKNAGIDLTSDGTYNLTKGIPRKIQLNEICLIPLEYCGMLFPRSSWHSKIQLQTGIIDAGYAEPLSTTVIPLEDCVVESGERFCQIVVLQIPKRKCMQFERDTIKSRGGYGSTGKF